MRPSIVSSKRVSVDRELSKRTLEAHAAYVELDLLVKRRHGRLHICLLGVDGRAVAVHDFAQQSDLGFIARALRRQVFERGVSFVLEGLLVGFELGLVLLLGRVFYREPLIFFSQVY